MKLFHRTTWTLSILVLMMWSTRAHAEPPVDYRLLVLRVDFVDAPGVSYANPADFRNGYVDALVEFWTEMSDGQGNIITTVIDDPMTLQERWHYHPCDPCKEPRECGDLQNTWCDCIAACGSSPGPESCCTTRDEDECDDLQDAWCDCIKACGSSPSPATCCLGTKFVVAQALSEGLIDVLPSGLVPLGGSEGEEFDDVLVVYGSPLDFPNDGYLARYGACGMGGWGAVASSGSAITGDPSGRRYGFAITKENPDCNTDTFDPKDIGGAAHEIGHIIMGWCGHPAGYISAYELMDSCYPCFTGAFTRLPSSVLGDGFSSCYPGWIPEARVEVFSPSNGGTTVLAPIELDPDDATSPMVVKVETAADGLFYLVECRRRIGWDEFGPDRDEGTLILLTIPGANPPTKQTKVRPDGSSTGKRYGRPARRSLIRKTTLR